MLMRYMRANGPTSFHSAVRPLSLFISPLVLFGACIRVPHQRLACPFSLSPGCGAACLSSLAALSPRLLKTLVNT